MRRACDTHRVFVRTHRYDCVTPTSITPETFAFTLDVTRGAYWTNAIAKALDHNPRRLNVRDCAYETPQFKVWRYENETACMSAITTRNDDGALEWLLPLNYTSRHSYPIGGGKGTAAKEEAGRCIVGFVSERRLTKP